MQNLMIFSLSLSLFFLEFLVEISWEWEVHWRHFAGKHMVQGKSGCWECTCKDHGSFCWQRLYFWFQSMFGLLLSLSSLERQPRYLRQLVSLHCSALIISTWSLQLLNLYRLSTFRWSCPHLETMQWTK